MAADSKTPEYHPRLDLIFIGRGLENETWTKIGRDSREQPQEIFFQPYLPLERPLAENSIIIIDAARMNPGPGEKEIRALESAAKKSGAAITVINYDLAEPGPWEGLLRLAEAVTALTRAAAYSLLDRGIRCVELGRAHDNRDPQDEAETGDGKAGLAGRIHAAVVEAMVARRSGPRPAVSIVVPVFNTSPRHLHELIKSALSQTSRDWELILLDNGDPAKTAPVVSEFSDPRIRYFGDLGGRGIAMGRNLGNLLARGKLLAVMDHDDLLEPLRVETVVAELSGRAAIMYSDVIQLFPDGGRELKKLKLFSEEELKRDCNIYHPTVACPWEVARAIPYDPRFEPSDDYRIYLAANRRGLPLVYVCKPLTIYRRHPVQYSSVARGRLQAVARAVRAEDRFLRAGGNPLDRQARFNPLIGYLLAFDCGHEARELMELGYGSPALKNMDRALQAMQPGKNSPPPETRKKIVEELLEDDPAAARQAAWIILQTMGKRRAAEFIETGLAKNTFGPRERNDLADLYFRLGEMERAEAELAKAAEGGQTPCLATFQQYLIGAWKKSMGNSAPQAPAILANPKEKDQISVIVSASLDDLDRLMTTINSLARENMPAFEILVIFSGKETPEIPVIRPGLSVTAWAVDDVLPGAKWNRGLEPARGKYIIFLVAGDLVDKDFPDRAKTILDGHPEMDAVLGQTGVGKNHARLPGRVMGLSAILREERAMVSGCLFRKNVLKKIGGFIPGLADGCGWELMIRAMTSLAVAQPQIPAGTSSRDPLSGNFLMDPGNHNLDESLETFSLVKYLHRPLRYLDYYFSGAPDQWLDACFSGLDGIIARAPGLTAFLDPWEYLSEFNSPYHILYRLSRKLERLGLFGPARQSLVEAIRTRPFEPKLWLRLFLLELSRLFNKNPEP